MDKRNIVLIDSSEEEGRDFIKGLYESTKKRWVLIVETSNDRRTKKSEIKRYIKYFWVPFRTFLKRNSYGDIIAWQQFYGIMFAFYCRLFHVRKKNKLIIMSFIYKEKKGLAGKLYKWLIKYVVTGKYADFFTSVASVQCDKLSREFNIPKTRFKFIPWGVTDRQPVYSGLIRENTEPYFFCAGRSNRDWNVVFNTFGNSNIPCKFIYSDTGYKGKYPNIDVRSNVPTKEYFDLLVNSYCVIIAIDNSDLAGGEITIINAMQFGKPVILIQDNPNNDYVFEGITGFVAAKDRKKILEIAEKFLNNKNLHAQMTVNARKYYEEHFTVFAVGKEIGKLV